MQKGGSSWAHSLAVGVFAWFVTRLAIELIAAWSFRLSGHPASWLHLWIQWDASYYLDIATHGYRVPAVMTGEETGQSVLNFFPLLPIGVFLTGLIIKPPVVAGLVFTNACLIGAASVLHRLAWVRLGRNVADWSVVSLMLLPGSFALSGVMSEAPFLLFSGTAAYFARRARPGWAAASLSLLAITRLTGIVLLAGFALDWTIDRWRHRSARYRTMFLFCLSPLPLFIYAAYMLHLTGDALVAVHSHQAFWSQKEGVPLHDFVLFAWTEQPRLQVQSVIGSSILLILLTRWRLFTLGEWLFLAASIQASSSADSLSPSLIRYMIALYPVHLAMGDLCSRSFAGRLLIGVYAMMNAGLAIYWAHGFDFYQ